MSKSDGKFLMKVYDALFERYGPRHWWPGDTRDEILIGAILTQNTAWTNVEKAIANLKGEGLLSSKAVAAANVSTLARLIRPAGYFNQKAIRLKEFFGHFEAGRETGHGRGRQGLDAFFSQPLEEARKQLLALRGIGPETADSMLLYAGNLPTFVIDAYTFRIFKRLGLDKKAYQKLTPKGLWKDDYENFRQFFLKNLPADVQLYNEYHALLVEHGKTHCRSKPACEGCALVGVCGGPG